MDCGAAKSAACLGDAYPNYLHWQPKEQKEPIVKADDTIVLYIDETGKIERKEDTMDVSRNVSRFDVDVIRKPTVVEEQGGVPVKEIGQVKDILASSKEIALMVAGAKIGKEKLADGSRLVVRVDERPFV